MGEYLNLDYFDTYRRVNFHVLIAGAGGTGGYLYYYLTRLIAARRDGRVGLVVADGDTVEERNLVRQNFAPEDLGRNKAERLAERYGNVYGLNFPYVDRYLENAESVLQVMCQHWERETWASGCVPVLVGCVDNNASRQVFHEVFKKSRNIIYIDCGNDEWSGQVVVGVKSGEKVVLPPVGELYPDILADRDSVFSSRASCEEAAVERPQNIATNIMAATLAFGILNRLLTTGRISVHAVTFNAALGLTRPQYITAEKVVEAPSPYGWPRLVAE